MPRMPFQFLKMDIAAKIFSLLVLVVLSFGAFPVRAQEQSQQQVPNPNPPKPSQSQPAPILISAGAATPGASGVAKPK